MVDSQDGFPEFQTKDEELHFWKSMANDLKIKLSESREELDEFQENSRELEAELEAQLEQQESRVRDLTARLARTQQDHQQVKDRLETLQTETHREIGDLQSDLNRLNTAREQMTKYVRQLEQQNDDLERVKRTTVVSLEDFESRLNLALERNAFLESELDEKSGLRDTVQRLKDESRDLRQELAVKQRYGPDELPSQPSLQPAPSQQPDNSRATAAAVTDTNRLSTAQHPAVGGQKPSKRLSLQLNNAGARDSLLPGSSDVIISGGDVTDQLTAAVSMSPGSRISALNIVGDLLRKVGALESKLATCKSYVRDNPKTSTIAATSRESPRGGTKSASRKPTRIPTQVQN